MALKNPNFCNRIIKMNNKTIIQTKLFRKYYQNPIIKKFLFQTLRNNF